VPVRAGDKVYPVRIVALHQKNNTVKLEADVYDVILEQPVPTHISSEAGRVEWQQAATTQPVPTLRSSNADSAERQQAATISIADLLRNVKDAGGKNYIDSDIYFQTTAGDRANIDRFTRDRMIAEGASLETVGKETGWWRGDDGKWRYEISDRMSSLNVPNKNGKYTGTLGKLLKHDRLFSAYPDLSQIDTEITINHSKMPYEYSAFEPGETLGNTDIPPKFIISASNPAAAKRALLKEVQNVISEKEGFEDRPATAASAVTDNTTKAVFPDGTVLPAKNLGMAESAEPRGMIDLSGDRKVITLLGAPNKYGH